MTTSTMTFTEFKDMALRHLPQAALIPEKNMRTWFESALAGNQPVEWYLHRLKAVGGSEIGIIVAHELGIPADFGKTRETLYRSKLMLDPLEPATDAMSFGVKHESAVQSMFEAMATKFGWQRAHAVLQLFKDRALSDQTVGGLGYSPDDAFIMEDGRLCMIDYKTPYRKVPTDKNIPMGYISQLHQGAYIAKHEIGLNPDHPLIANGVEKLLVYGIHPESKCTNRTKEMYLLSFDIEHNQQIEDIIATKGKSFFSDFVLQGKSPTMVQEDIDAMVSMSTELLDLRRAKLAAEAQVAEAKAEADRIIKAAQTKLTDIDANIDSVSTRLTDIYLRSESRSDTDKALKAAGVVAKASVTETVVVSVDSIRSYAEEVSLDIGDFIQEKSTGKMDMDRVIEAFRQVAPDRDMAEFEIKKEIIDVKSVIESGEFPEEFIGKAVTWKFAKADLSPVEDRADESPVVAQNSTSLSM